jgi:hypothetical protein
MSQPEPVCVCGHAKPAHGWNGWPACRQCDCKRWREAGCTCRPARRVNAARERLSRVHSDPPARSPAGARFGGNTLLHQAPLTRPCTRSPRGRSIHRAAGQAASAPSSRTAVTSSRSGPTTSVSATWTTCSSTRISYTASPGSGWYGGGRPSPARSTSCSQRPASPPPAVFTMARLILPSPATRVTATLTPLVCPMEAGPQTHMSGQHDGRSPDWPPGRHPVTDRRNGTRRRGGTTPGKGRPGEPAR